MFADPMPIFLALALQATAPTSGSLATPEQRYDQCVDAAINDPPRGEQVATQWRLTGGEFLARQCLGMSYTARQQWAAAAQAFEQAAREAELARDVRAANYWAQAGNAHLAEGDTTAASAALDAALANGSLSGLALGEAHLDRARVRVAANDLPGARGDLDQAIAHAPADPLSWLLSATLARRMNDLPRARADIAEALRRASDDASVQLEAGNIAGLSGDMAAARAAFEAVLRISPDGPQGKVAAIAIEGLPPN